MITVSITLWGNVVDQDRVNRLKGLATDETDAVQCKKQRRGPKSL